MVRVRDAPRRNERAVPSLQGKENPTTYVTVLFDEGTSREARAQQCFVIHRYMYVDHIKSRVLSVRLKNVDAALVLQQCPSNSFITLVRRRTLYFLQGHPKHEIPGLGMRGDCSSGGRAHEDDFGYGHPCSESSDFTREALTACLPDRSPSCARYLPPLDQAVRRCGVWKRECFVCSPLLSESDHGAQEGLQCA